MIMILPTNYVYTSRDGQDGIGVTFPEPERVPTIYRPGDPSPKAFALALVRTSLLAKSPAGCEWAGARRRRRP